MKRPVSKSRVRRDTTLRGDFPKTVLETLAKRVGYRCSNPTCRKPTNGPHTDEAKALNVGVAGHRRAEAVG